MIGRATVLLFCLCVPALGAEESAIEVGRPAPDFKVPGLDDTTFELSARKGKQPVVLVFSRAHWCPFCTAHMRALQNAYPRMKELGAEVVVVFREEKTLEGVAKSRAAAKAEFVMVSDLGKSKTKAYSPEGFAVYVVDEGGIVRAILEGTKAKRPAPERIIAVLERLAEPE